MLYAVRNAKAHPGAPGKAPFLKFDLGVFETTDINSLVVVLIGVRYLAGEFLPAQTQLANRSYWSHWMTPRRTEAKMLELVQLEPAWAEYQRLARLAGGDPEWSQPVTG